MPKPFDAFLKMFFFLLLAGWSTVAAAQIPGMRKYTQLDGYTATTGYEMEQDEKGYIAIGTDNGGMRFDGKIFHALQNEARHSPDKEILFCCPLGAGRILLIPLFNTVSYVEKGGLVTAKEDTALRRIQAGHNNNYHDPVTKAFWLSGGGSLNVLHRFRGKQMQHYSVNDTSIIFNTVINGCFLGCRRIGADEYLGMYDLAAGAYHYFRDSAGQKMAGAVYGEVFTSGPNYEYITTYNEAAKRLYFFKYKLNDSTLHLAGTVPLPVKEVFGRPIITIDPKGRIWLKLAAPDGGIFVYNDIKNLAAQPRPYHFPEPVLINSIFIDHINNIWISTPNNALYFLSEKHFRNLLLTSRMPYTKATPQAIAGNGKGGICISYYNQNQLTCVRDHDTATISLNRNFVGGSRHILPLDDTRFILFSNGVALFDISTRKVTYLGLRVLCKDLCYYGNKALLIATPNGLFYSRTPFVKGAPLKHIFYKRATTVDVLPDSTILIGTPDGLYIQRTLSSKATKTDHPLLRDCNITDLLTVQDGNVFIGTNAHGLFMMNGTPDNIRPVKIAEGSTAKHIRRLYKQNDSTYWIATDDGAYSMIFDRRWQLKSTQHYTFYDGLPSDNVTDIYVCRDTAYFTTMQGLGIIPLKDSAHLQMAAPSLFVDKISAGDTVFYEPDSVVSLSSGRNNLLLSLSAISYESLGNIHFYYQLRPFQNDWIETTNPEVRFTELPPGVYTFKAYATNARGTRSKQVVMTIRIRPAFWQTIYFKMALLLFAGTLLYFVLRWRIRKAEKQKFEKIQQKKHLAELELEAIKAQINPHFIYNCLNSIQYLNYTAAPQQTQEYLSAFARMIRMTMEYSRRIFITLQEETDYLTNYLKLEKLRLKEKLNYSIEIADGIGNVQLPAMMLQPYVENALKHGIAKRKTNGQLWIRFQKRGDNLHIFIRDNGPGFSGMQSSGSLGMHLAGTRVLSYRELFNLDIRVQCYNEQDPVSGSSGAVVEIILNTTSYGNAIYKSGTY
jgi:hypothetical protein